MQTIVLLVCSNLFMTMAWYGHLKNLADRPWCDRRPGELGHRAGRVPAAGAGQPHRLPQAGFSVAQLKIMQEVITLSVFVPFAVLYLNQPLKLDYLWAALCMVGAAYFMFRSG